MPVEKNLSHTKGAPQSKECAVEESQGQAGLAQLYTSTVPAAGSLQGRWSTTVLLTLTVPVTLVKLLSQSLKITLGLPRWRSG